MKPIKGFKRRVKSAKQEILHKLFLQASWKHDRFSSSSTQWKFSLHSSTYERFIILGELNVKMRDPKIKSFCDNYSSLKSLTKEPIFYKSPTNPTCIDLILTNRSQSFQGTCVLGTGFIWL